MTTTTENYGIVDFESYIPTEKQKLAHRSGVKFKLFGGAFGGGKSMWLVAEAIRLSITFAGNNGLLARFRYRDLKKTTLPILLEMLPRRIIKSYNKSDGLIVLKNNSQIILGDLENPEKHKSLNLGWFAIDEATECPENVFNMLKTRLRRKVPNIRYFGLLATNPEPGWIKDTFLTNPGKDYKYFPALPTDNPHLPEGYVDDLMKDLPPIWRAKYLEGSWDVFDAQIFKPQWITPSKERGEIAFKIMAVDPAITEKELVDKDNDPDETAIVTLGVEYGTNIIHELETITGCWGFNDIIENIKAAYDRNRPDILGIEMVAFQKSLGDVLTKDGYTVLPFKADTDKIRRAITVQSFFERGRIKVNTPKAQTQLIEFPKGSHDDIVDAIVYGLRYIREYSEDEYTKSTDKYKHLDGRSKDFWMSQNDELPHQKANKLTGGVANFYNKLWE